MTFSSTYNYCILSTGVLLLTQLTLNWCFNLLEFEHSRVCLFSQVGNYVISCVTHSQLVWLKRKKTVLQPLVTVHFSYGWLVASLWLLKKEIVSQGNGEILAEWYWQSKIGLFFQKSLAPMIRPPVKMLTVNLFYILSDNQMAALQPVCMIVDSATGKAK